MMAATAYPKRESHYAHKLIRLMIRVCAAQEIGCSAAWLVTIIAHTEDAKRYLGPVTFWNDQLLSVVGFTSWGQLDRARKRAVDGGWLHYEAGGKGKVGKYWTTTPEGLEAMPDGSTECDYPHVFLTGNGEETGGEPGEKRGTTGGEPGEKRGTSAEHSSLTLSPSPSPGPKSPKGDGAFDIFWAMVLKVAPHKAKSKQEAKKRYTEAVRDLAKLDAPHAFLLDRATAYYSSPEGQSQYANGPAPWLNQGRYDDDPAAWERSDGAGQPAPPEAKVWHDFKQEP